MFKNRHIGPPSPRRDTQLAAQFIDAVNSTALIATGDDDLIFVHADDEFLGFTLQGLTVDDLTFDKVVTGIEVKEGEWPKLEEFTNNFQVSNYYDNISFIKPVTAYYSDGKLSELEEGDCFITCVDEDENANNQHPDLLSIDKTFTLFYDNEISDKVYVCTTYDRRCKLINCDVVLYKKFEKSAFKKRYKGKSNLFVIEECKKVTDELYKKYYDDIMVSINDCITNLVKLKNILDDFRQSVFHQSTK